MTAIDRDRPSARLRDHVTSGADAVPSDASAAEAVKRLPELTAVGAGTLGGELLRRYWHPVAAASELPAGKVKALRVLGEDLVLYKDRAGRIGLLAAHCPHRRADLSYGWVEDCGLRCSYHGWLFDDRGACLEQPYEDVAAPEARLKDRIRQRAYRASEKAGMIWAYLGPEPAPEIPDWEPFTWPDGFIQVVTAVIPCNWLQAQDNSIDPVHFEWLHDTWSPRLHGDTSYRAPRHQVIAFEEFEFGFTYKRMREHDDESSELWTVGRVCLWPNALFTGNHFEWRVPVDDVHTLSIGWFFDPVPLECRPYAQQEIPHWEAQIADSDSGRWLTSHIMNQDFAAWIGQGAVADRENEHLGRSDRGVVAMRRRIIREAQKVAAGEPPGGLIFDPERNHAVPLPIVNRRMYVEGPTLAEHREMHAQSCARYGGPFRFLAGQPEEVRDQYERAMGGMSGNLPVARQASAT